LKGVEILASTGIRSLGLPARSGSLYRLSYRRPLHAEIENLKGFITSILITITVVVVIIFIVAVAVVYLYFVQHVMLFASKSILISQLNQERSDK
jgi:hypothetical protein